MARYRQVHTKIWKDGWFAELEPEHKLFFMYLFTNELASISGLFELPKRVMIFETGLTSKQIDDAFAIFSAADKAYFEDGIVWVVNLRKYHETKSPKVQAAITKDIEAVKPCNLKEIYSHRYGIDTLSDSSDRVSIPRSSISSSSSSSSSSSISSNDVEVSKNEPSPPNDTTEYDALWVATLDQLRPSMERATYENNFLGSQLILDGKTAVIVTKNQFAADWINAKMKNNVSRILRAITEKDYAIFARPPLLRNEVPA